MSVTLMQEDHIPFSNSPENERVISPSTSSSAVLLHSQKLGLFLEAALKGELRTVRHFIEDHNLCPNTSVDSDGSTALHKAAAKNHVRILSYLIEKGASVDTKDNLCTTALHWAAANDHIEAICLLAKHSKNIEVMDIYGYTPLHSAVKTDSVRAVETLSSLFRASVTSKNNVGMTPLHTACEQGYLSMIEFLQRFPTVTWTATDNIGNTPLMRAVSAGKIEVVKYMIQRHSVTGSTQPLVKVKDYNSKTVLHKAAESQRTEVLQYLCTQNPEDILSWVDEPATGGFTPLHCAVLTKNKTSVETLIDLGKAALNPRTDKRETPIALAAAASAEDVVLALLRRGAKPPSLSSSERFVLKLSKLKTQFKDDLLSPRKKRKNRNKASPQRYSECDEVYSTSDSLTPRTSISSDDSDDLTIGSL